MINIETHYAKLAPTASPFLRAAYQPETRFKIIGIDFLYGDLQAICVLSDKRIVLIKYPESFLYDGPAEDEPSKEIKQKKTTKKVEDGDNNSNPEGSTGGENDGKSSQGTDVKQLTESKGTNE